MSITGPSGAPSHSAASSPVSDLDRWCAVRGGARRRKPPRRSRTWHASRCRRNLAETTDDRCWRSIWDISVTKKYLGHYCLETWNHRFWCWLGHPPNDICLSLGISIPHNYKRWTSITFVECDPAADILSHISSDILSNILSGISSDVLTWHLFWQTIWHCTWQLAGKLALAVTYWRGSWRVSKWVTEWECHEMSCELIC